MMAVTAEQSASIRAKAETLSGQSLSGDGDALVAMACQRALSLCQREDIPPEMEQVVAALVLELAGGEEVSSLTRGDTSMTFARHPAAELLAPFRRLGRVLP